MWSGAGLLFFNNIFHSKLHIFIIPIYFSGVRKMVNEIEIICLKHARQYISYLKLLTNGQVSKHVACLTATHNCRSFCI